MQKWLKLISVLSLCLIYYWIGYELKRPEFGLLFGLYSAAFGFSIYLYKSGLSLKFLVALSFLFKLIFLLSIPELSQDFTRFIWDGMLTTNGYNPYLYLPIELIENNTFKEETLHRLLYEKMGELNANNYSTYPPIAQFVYSLGYAVSGSNLLMNIVFLRLINILAEVGIVWFSVKVLSHLNLPKTQILFFIMNPLVILESSFNLHFEVVMLFFLGLSLYYLFTTKKHLSAFGLTGAIASKMLPLMFLPLLLPYFNNKNQFLNKNQILRYFKYIGLVIVGLILQYSVFWDNALLSKSSKTLSLYFTSFEFNASFYYVLRWIGYLWSGYNQIEVIGTSLTIVSSLFILFLSFKYKNIGFQKLITYMLFASTTYYLFSTTVHPWYIMLPLFLSIFTTYRYMMAWSWLVFLSYAAYKIDGVEEELLLIAIEYTVVIGLIIYNFKNKLLGSLC